MLVYSYMNRAVLFLIEYHPYHLQIILPSPFWVKDTIYLAILSSLTLKTF
jgi:hypothetical protein